MNARTSSEIRVIVRGYVLSEFLPDENPDALHDDTPLVSSGVLDSIATAKLVSHLEETLGVRFAAHEVNAGNLDTIDRIVTTMEAKLGK